MPVEIKELTIKVNINQQQPGTSSSAPAQVTGSTDDEKEALVKDTVEQVLRILDNKKER